MARFYDLWFHNRRLDEKKEDVFPGFGNEVAEVKEWMDNASDFSGFIAEGEKVKKENEKMKKREKARFDEFEKMINAISSGRHFSFSGFPTIYPPIEAHEVDRERETRLQLVTRARRGLEHLRRPLDFI